MSILSLHVALASCKKIKKVPCIDFVNTEKLILGTFKAFFGKRKLFPKNNLR